MKLVILSLGESLLASSPGFSVPRDRTFNYIEGSYQSKPVSVNNTDKDQLSLPGLINDVPVLNALLKKLKKIKPVKPNQYPN